MRLPMTTVCTLSGVGVAIALLTGCDSDSETAPGPAPTSTTPPAEVIKNFECDEKAVTKPTPISDIDGVSGATLEISPTDTPCQFDLSFKDSDGTRTKLSSKASGYLLGVGGKAPNGDILICVSNIQHGLDPSPEEANANANRMTNVTVECAVRKGKNWSALSTIVDGKGKWAAWTGTVSVAQDGSDTYRVNFIHDSTFQFLNMYDEGRPDADGAYTADFTRSGSKLVLSKTAKVSDSILKRTPAGWQPSDDDKKAAAPYVDFESSSN